MWYCSAKNIKVAGADNVLQGRIAPLETVKETLAPYQYVGRIEFLPSHDSIIHYFKNEVSKKLRQWRSELAESDALGVRNTITHELYACVNFLKYCIILYESNPKYAHLRFSLYAELVPLSSLLSELDQYYKPYSNPMISYDTDDSYWLSNFLSGGYNNILNLEKLGLFLSPKVKFAIMSGMDWKAKPELKNDPQRENIVNYISEKYPFYRRFLIVNGDDTGVQEACQKLVNPDEEFIKELIDSLHPFEKINAVWNNRDVCSDMITTIFTCGLPTKDHLRYAKIVAETKTNDPRDEQDKLFAIEEAVKSVNNTKISDNIDFVLDDAFPNIDDDQAKQVLKQLIGKMTWHNPGQNIKYEEAEKIKNNPIVKKIFDDLWEKYKDNPDGIVHEFLVKIGYAPLESIIEFVKDYPRTIDYIMVSDEIYSKIEDATKKHREEQERNALEEASRALNEREKKAKEEANASLMQRHINKGSIVHEPLSEAANGKYLDMALKIGESLRLDPDIVRRWANFIQVYTVTNSDFENELQETKSLKYDNLNDLNFLGVFIPSFNKDENVNKRIPAIFVRQDRINSQYKDMPILKILNISSDEVMDAIVSHEIAHALNYLATGGEFVRENPEYQSKNRSRQYLTSYTEILARVYGEMPKWRSVLTQQIERLRDTEIVKEAVLEEITEQFMMHESYAAMGGIHPINEYKKLNDGQYPYNYAENPIEAANKRVERAKQKVMSHLMESARQRRREVLLDIIKKIKYYEEQLRIVEQIDSEDGDNSKENHQDELKKLKAMKFKALNGGYDFEIDSSIQSVIMNFITRELKNMSYVVADHNWKPPATLTTKDGEEIPQVYAPTAEPLNYQELQHISNADFNWSQGPQGGRTLEEPKNMELDFPTKRPGYDAIFRDETEPFYQARMSFNFKKWKK